MTSTTSRSRAEYTVAAQRGILTGDVLSQVDQPYPGFQQECGVARLQYNCGETDFVQHVPEPISALRVPRSRGAASGCATDQQSQSRVQQVRQDLTLGGVV